jgi:hypothetical protein
MSNAQEALNVIAAEIDSIAAVRRARAAGSRTNAVEEDAAATLLGTIAADIRAARIRDPKTLRDMRALQFARPKNIRWQGEGGQGRLL